MERTKTQVRALPRATLSSGGKGRWRMARATEPTQRTIATMAAVRSWRVNFTRADSARASQIVNVRIL
jgi:hypothetical protein